ncbi:MAG: glycerol-3-phosphate acyltransferase [Dehalococcoidia bacterium]
MPDTFALTVSSVLAYLLGALPFAYLVPRLLKGVDIRRVGSGNPGALNVYRSLGSAPGLAVFALDAAKGLLAIYLTRWLDAPEASMYLAALLVAVGHNWSVFLRFSGGKGAATVFGVSLAVLPWMTLGVLAFTGATLAVTRRAVISFGTGFMLLNALTVATSQPGGQIAMCLVLTSLVAGTHFARSAPDVMALAQQGRWRDLAHLE